VEGFKLVSFFFFYKDRIDYFPVTISQPETLMKAWRKADGRNAADLYTSTVYKLQAETKYKVTEFLSKSMDYGETV